MLTAAREESASRSASFQWRRFIYSPSFARRQLDMSSKLDIVPALQRRDRSALPIFAGRLPLLCWSPACDASRLKVAENEQNTYFINIRSALRFE